MSDFKDLQKKVDNEIKSYENKVDEQYKSVIDITVYDDSDLLSPYSYSDVEIITDKLASYIEHNAMAINPKKPLHIFIHSNEISDNEKEKYAQGIKNYYFKELIDVQRTLSQNTIISLLFVLISAIIFALHFSFIEKLNIATLSEIIIIIGWVFVWEAVHISFIQSYDLKRKKYRYINIFEAKLSFVKLDDTKSKKIA